MPAAEDLCRPTQLASAALAGRQTRRHLTTFPGGQHPHPLSERTHSADTQRTTQSNERHTTCPPHTSQPHPPPRQQPGPRRTTPSRRHRPDVYLPDRHPRRHRPRRLRRPDCQRPVHVAPLGMQHPTLGPQQARQDPGLSRVQRRSSTTSAADTSPQGSSNSAPANCCGPTPPNRSTSTASKPAATPTSRPGPNWSTNSASTSTSTPATASPRCGP